MKPTPPTSLNNLSSTILRSPTNQIIRRTLRITTPPKISKERLKQTIIDLSEYCNAHPSIRFVQLIGGV